MLSSEAADALLLDIHLPTMSGLALYLAIIHRWPALEGHIAIMTGDAEAEEVRTWLDTTLHRHPQTVQPEASRRLGIVGAAERPRVRRHGRMTTVAHATPACAAGIPEPRAWNLRDLSVRGGSGARRVSGNTINAAVAPRE